MSSYRQLLIEERCEIARLHQAVQSIRQVASALDRQPSTISRELKRNAGRKIGYQPSYAQQQAAARRWSGSRLDRDDALREIVLDRMAEGWSPSRSPAVWRAKPATASSATKASTASSMPR